MIPAIRYTMAVLAVLLLSSCAAEKKVYVPREFGAGSVVAVWDLEDYSVTANQMLTEMNEFFTATISQTLEQEGGYQLIERQKLLLALEELSLGSSQLASESTRLEVGKIIGAEAMVFGAYQLIGKQLRFDLRLVDVESGAVVKAAEHTTTAADTAGWIAAAEQAARQLVKREQAD